YFEKQKIYVASGNAKASKGKFSVKADNITAFMGKIKNSDITYIEATGNVINCLKLSRQALLKRHTDNHEVYASRDNCPQTRWTGFKPSGSGAICFRSRFRGFQGLSIECFIDGNFTKWNEF
ncbi:MAG: hypothetical protein VXU42_03730, partial [Verrucomicrobiota bacterium]|nr:hypothetical protein [Verrucomicrobiota bacterium]